MFKKVLFVLIVSSLLIGCAFATSIDDFKIDDNVKEIYSSAKLIVYADEHSDGGIAIYKTLDEDEDDDTDDDDAIDNLVHDDGDEYLIGDDDVSIQRNSDKTANFTDRDHGTQGISEVIDHNGEKHIVVFWAKNSSDMDMAKLQTLLNDFNKNNNATPIAF